MKIISIEQGIPTDRDKWIRLSFHSETFNRIVQIILNEPERDDLLKISAELFISADEWRNGVIFRRPSDGIWIKFSIKTHFSEKGKNNAHCIAQRKLFNHFDLFNKRIIAINTGKNFRKLYNIIFYKKLINEPLLCEGFTDCIYHTWVIRCYGGLCGDWLKKPGFLVCDGDDSIRFIPLQDIIKWIWEEFPREDGELDTIGSFLIIDLFHSLQTYHETLVDEYYREWNSLNLICTATTCDEDEIPTGENLIDQELVVNLISDFVEQHFNYRCPDFFRKTYLCNKILGYLEEKCDELRNHPDLKKQTDLLPVITKYFWKFIETYHRERRGMNRVYDDLIKFLEGSYIPSTTYFQKKKLWKCIKNHGNNALPIGGRWYFPVLDYRNIILDELELISEWKVFEWKKKEILGDEFFFINKLRGPEDQEWNNTRTIQRIDTEGVVVSITQHYRKDRVLVVKFVNKEKENLYSFQIDREEFKTLSKKNGGIRLGSTIRLKATLGREYRDETYFVPIRSLYGVHGIVKA